MLSQPVVVIFQDSGVLDFVLAARGMELITSVSEGYILNLLVHVVVDMVCSVTWSVFCCYHYW